MVGRGGLEPPASAVTSPVRCGSGSGRSTEIGGVIRRDRFVFPDLDNRAYLAAARRNPTDTRALVLAAE